MFYDIYNYDIASHADESTPYTSDFNLKEVIQKLQSVTKYLRLTLAFMWKSVPRENFNRYFWRRFC